MSYFKHDNLQFYYTEVGDGIPFIFQHGLGGSVDQINKIYKPLPGIRLITFDFRGHGKTQLGTKDKLNFITFADDIAALMNHLDLQNAIVGGISMGAAVSLNFTLRYPAQTSGLILSRPAWLDEPMEEQNRNLFRFIVKLIRVYGTEEGRRQFIISDVYTQLFKTSPSTAKSFLSHFDYEKVSETAAKYECLPEDRPSDNRNEWKNISIPTLILANKSDPVHPFEYGQEYASHISQAEFKEIASKAISEEQHNKDVQKNIDTFISKISKSSTNKLLISQH